LVECPCCGYDTLYGDRYETCFLCHWEDDGQDDPYADEVWGVSNQDYSLTEARENFKTIYSAFWRSSYLNYVETHSDEIKLKKKIIYVFDKIKWADSEGEILCLKSELNTLKERLHKMHVRIDEREIRTNLLLSAQHALLDSIPCSLRGVTVGWKGTVIMMRCIFDGDISDDARELLSIAATEILADFPSPYTISFECIRVDAPKDTSQYFLKNWVYSRYENNSEALS